MLKVVSEQFQVNGGNKSATFIILRAQETGQKL